MSHDPAHPHNCNHDHKQEHKHKHEHVHEHAAEQKTAVDCGYSHGPHGHSHSHGHDHSHSHLGHHHHGADGSRRGLLIALALTAGIMLVEFGGGLVTGSLALLSDSGHMLSDAASLLLSLLAIGFAAMPPSTGKSYGYYRFEILAALVNGITLFAVSAFIIWEAIHRLLEPPAVSSGIMIGIACIGLLANAGSAWSLMRQGNIKDNINIRSAYLHVVGDALGSVGAITAGIVMWAFGWYIADPIISMVVALLILKSAWGVLKQSVHILMEGTPSHLDQDELKQSLLGIGGVVDVHDLHVWSLTSGMDALSCHLVIRDGAESQSVLQAAIEQLAKQFNMTHATIQVETTSIRHAELH